MCGIVGFTGNRQAAPILLDGLSKLEYRGYDSAGLAVRDGENLAQVVKAKGRLSNLIEKTDGGKALKGTCGIGHTRWATHGEPSQTNAHPHVSGNCTRSGSGTVESEVVGVHNGIIENDTELKEKLLKHGYTFYSQTDTEVVIKLVDYYYKKYNLGPIDAIAKTMVRVRGSYALELMFRDYPGEIWVARKDSPMIIGIADGETYVASDVPAILKCLTTLYHIQGSISLLDCVHRINHFFKLLTLNLNTVSVHHYPVRDGIFFCQFPQLAFSDTEIFCCFFYGKSVLFPNRHVVIVQFVVPLS